MSIKVAYNRCYGGFSLSRKAVLRARNLSGNPAWGGATIKGDFYPADRAGGKPQKVTQDYGHLDHDFPRHDKVLVQVIEELGKEANGFCADLGIAEVAGPYRVDEYDGNESIMEPGGYDWIYPEVK